MSSFRQLMMKAKGEGDIYKVPLYLKNGLSANGLVVSGWNNSNRYAYILPPIDFPVVANEPYEINIKYKQSSMATWGWYVVGFKDRALDRYEFENNVNLYISHEFNVWTYVKMIFKATTSSVKEGTIYVSTDGENWQSATGSKTVSGILSQNYLTKDTMRLIGSDPNGYESILSGSGAIIDFNYFSLKYMGTTIIVDSIING